MRIQEGLRPSNPRSTFCWILSEKQPYQNLILKAIEELKLLVNEEIAISVVEKCGYPIELSGEKGIQQFKNYYLSKDNDSD